MIDGNENSQRIVSGMKYSLFTVRDTEPEADALAKELNIETPDCKAIVLDIEVDGIPCSGVYLIRFLDRGCYEIEDTEGAKILKDLGIDPCSPIIDMDKAYALNELIEYTKDSGLDAIDFSKFDKESMTALLSEYASSIIEYHPESNHQERGALIGIWETLKTLFNITDDEYDVIDFD